MILRWLLILFSTSLLVSQSAMDLFASLLVISILWTGFRWREQRSTHSIFNSIGWDWIFLFWIVAMLVSYAANGFGYDEWWREVLDLKWILIFYLLVAALRYLDPSRPSWTAIAIIFGICSLYAIVVWFLGFDPIRPEEQLQNVGSENWPRTGGLLGQPIVFAHLYQIPLCLLFGSCLMMMRWNEKARWLLAGSTCLGLSALVFSFTRGAWISFGGALVVMTLLFSRRLAIIFVLGAVLFVGGLYEFWPQFHTRVTQASAGGDSERLWIWKANLQMWKDHPVFGIGLQANKEALREYFPRVGAPENLIISHAHNEYLHVGAGMGIVGLAAYLLILFYFLTLSFRVWTRVTTRNSSEKGIILGLIGAQVAFILGGLTEANFEHAKMKYVIVLVWALVIWLSYKYRILRDRI